MWSVVARRPLPHHGQDQGEERPTAAKRRYDGQRILICPGQWIYVEIGHGRCPFSGGLLSFSKVVVFYISKAKP